MNRFNKKWKHHIKIKHLFEDETTPELVVKLCDELVKQLKPILDKYATSDDEDDIYYELELHVDNFEFLRSLADGSIEEKAWSEYGFDGDFEEEFNGYLSQLYDFADQDKLIWIG